MNLTDLRDELDTRSTPDLDLLGPARLAGVRNRIGAIRRRRVAGAVAVVAAVAAIVAGYGLTPRPTAHPEPAETLPTERMINGFHEYAVGAHLVATGSAGMHDVLTLTANVGPRGPALSTRCEGLPESTQVWLEWTVNGHSFGGNSCSSPDGSGHRWMAPEDWVKLVGKTDKPVTFTVKAVPKTWGGQQHPVPDGTIHAAVLDRLPFEDYPLPPRPDRLEPLDEVDPPADMISTLVNSNIAYPGAPVTVTVNVRPGAQLNMTAQTPGYLKVFVNGKLLTTGEWWDYEHGVSGAVLADGKKGRQKLTLRFESEHMTGAWRAVIGV